MSPPLRERLEQNALWGAIRDREIKTIGTDHAPFSFADQKTMGRDDFTKIPNGIPSIQERVDLVHTYGVCQDRINLATMVDACSTQAAKHFNLYPRKGEIAVGSDADLVVYDPSYRGTFSNADSLTKVDYCGYEGMERKGRSHVVTLRGQVVARDGAFTGEPGRGTYLPRTATP
jgi:dihydropyrimidinase